MVHKKYLLIGLRILIVLLAVILGAFAIYFLGRLVIPFIIGFLIAFMMNPLVDFLQRKTKMPRGFAVLASIIIITGVISTIITLLVNEIIRGYNYLSSVLPEHYQNFTDYLEHVYLTQIIPFYQNVLHLFQNLEEEQRSTILDTVPIIGEKITTSFSSLVQALGNGLLLVIKGLPNMATVFIIALLAAFFISKDWHHIVGKIHRKIPEKVQVRINQVYEGLQRALLGFLKAEFKITFISAVIVFIGLFIMRVEHALSIALIIWMIDFLPYVGAILIFLPWAIYCFSTGDYFLGTGLAILYGLIILQRQLIKPKILSSSIGISPLMVLITMYVGFKLIGFLGIVIGPLTFIMVKILHETGILKDIWQFMITGKTPPK